MSRIAPFSLRFNQNTCHLASELISEKPLGKGKGKERTKMPLPSRQVQWVLYHLVPLWIFLLLLNEMKGYLKHHKDVRCYNYSHRLILNLERLDV